MQSKSGMLNVSKSSKNVKEVLAYDPLFNNATFDVIWRAQLRYRYHNV